MEPLAFKEILKIARDVRNQVHVTLFFIIKNLSGSSKASRQIVSYEEAKLKMFHDFFLMSVFFFIAPQHFVEASLRPVAISSTCRCIELSFNELAI